jgi:hypothetical protein
VLESEQLWRERIAIGGDIRWVRVCLMGGSGVGGGEKLERR